MKEKIRCLDHATTTKGISSFACSVEYCWKESLCRLVIRVKLLLFRLKFKIRGDFEHFEMKERLQSSNRDSAKKNKRFTLRRV